MESYLTRRRPDCAKRHKNILYKVIYHVEKIQCVAKGRAHIANEVPCQDKTYGLYQNDVNVIALADGAGSAELSHIGAECVTKSICRYFSENFDKLYIMPEETCCTTIIKFLIHELDDMCSIVECDRQSLASTLLATAVKGDKIITLHIGDGVIGCISDNGLEVISHPDNGEFSNITFFVTSHNSLTHTRITRGKCNNIKGICMMSDGAGDVLYIKHGAYLLPVVGEIMEKGLILPAEHLQFMLQDSIDNVIVPRTTDDCSIAIMLRSDIGEETFAAMSDNETYELLNVDPNATKANLRLNRYLNILDLCQTPCHPNQIAQAIHIRPKHIKKVLSHLERCGLIVKIQQGYYVSTIGTYDK